MNPVIYACFFLIIGVAPTRAADSAAIANGAGHFVFSIREGAAERSIKIWTYRPKALTADNLVLFVMHGVGREGERYRNEWQAYAERAQALLLVPEFSKANFPGRRNYSAPQPADAVDNDGATPFAFAAIGQIFDSVIKSNKLTASAYRLYGHSAGAQFVHRFVMSVSDARAKVAVAANAGWYMMPELETTFPYGLKGSGVDAESLQRALGRKLIVLLGEKDTDPNHPQLNRSAQAMRQGANRLERGQTFFHSAERQAEKLKVAFSWELRKVANAAHSNAAMARAAAPLLLR
jgi:poly(3-hydroxybutyrate) depolymerase